MISVAKFHNVINSLRNRHFSWETRIDCLYGLVVPVLKATTGREYFVGYAKYKTATGALRVMKSAGFATLADLAASELEEIHPSQAVMGDVVAIPSGNEFGYALGIANTDRAFVMGEFGLGTRPMTDAERAFRAK